MIKDYRRLAEVDLPMRDMPRDHLCDWPKIAATPAASALEQHPRRHHGSDARIGPELRLRNVAAQTRIVSGARIRGDLRKSVRPFKAIVCDDISEFESYMPSHAVVSTS